MISPDSAPQASTAGPVRGPGAAVTRMLEESGAPAPSALVAHRAALERSETIIRWSLWSADAVLVIMVVVLLRPTPLSLEFWKEWALGALALGLGSWLAILALASPNSEKGPTT